MVRVGTRCTATFGPTNRRGNETLATELLRATRLRIVGCVLTVDVTRAARSHHDRIKLLEAIRDAPVHEPETDWLEWKSQLDLSQADGRATAARSILAFGNRDPVFAATQADGCGYLVAGLAPGSLTGITPHDPADVEQWLSPYIAYGEPQWSVDYLDLDGTPVMLIVVEAPRWGDPIFTLQKGIGKRRAGAIYVRRNGKIEEAGPDDVRRLAARTVIQQPSSSLEVAVHLRAPADLHALGDIRAAAAAFVLHEAEDLAWFPSTSQFYAVGRDVRTDEEYQRDLETYLDRAPKFFELAVIRELIDQRVTHLSLELENLSDQNFPKTEVALTVAPDVQVFFDRDEIDELMEDMNRPIPWGRKGIGSIGSVRPMINLPQMLGRSTRRIERHPDGIEVTLDTVDVRPGTRHQLGTFELVLPESYAGGKLSLQWRATSTGVPGDAKGEVTLSVSDSLMLPVPNLSNEDES